eukprot:TRINITY_DN22668_c0_g1_i1.p1 TRINITY_DN22668_c0_g1~~TRINITY_DN22668_c0_g1_i1.p1  ORF type:complete len:123 (+),score=35.06 TRINITY_DN22668_c0_g1_i1:1-369(+)
MMCMNAKTVVSYDICDIGRFFFFKQKTAYEMQRGLVGSEMCIRDRRISYPEFRSYVTKSKIILKLMSQAGLISKDDLRPNFGIPSMSDVPDCDSDLEQEVLYKGFNSKQQRLKKLELSLIHI